MRSRPMSANLPPCSSRPRQAASRLAIIDTAPHSSAAAAIAAKLADYVLIPCRPARFDLDAIASTLEIAKAANTPAAVVINAAATRGRLAEEARAALTRQGVTVIETVLHQRAAYSHAVIDGRSVHEYEPKGAAAAEIDELYNHITRLYGKLERRGKPHEQTTSNTRSNGSFRSGNADQQRRPRRPRRSHGPIAPDALLAFLGDRTGQEAAAHACR